MAAKKRRTTKRPPKRRNPSLPAAARRQLEAARRLARKFHGKFGGAQVVELSPTERRPLSRFAVALGDLVDVTYGPDRKSTRGRNLWTHTSGDRGILKQRARNKPLLIVDPKTRRPALALNRSPMKLDPDHGLVG